MLAEMLHVQLRDRHGRHDREVVVTAKADAGGIVRVLPDWGRPPRRWRDRGPHAAR
jgi:hypothetical protein